MSEAKDSSSSTSQNLESSNLPRSTKRTRQDWLQLLSTTIIFLNTWGILLTFGVFQAYYEAVLLRSKSSSDISWISTTSAFLLLSGGIITGPLFDYGWYKSLVFTGSILQVLGLMMMSLSRAYYSLFLTQAICVGLGAGMIFTPSLAAAVSCLPDPATRARTIGLMACASSAGGVIYPLMFRYLIDNLGFPWTVRVIAFVVLGTYIFSYPALLRPSRKAPSVRRLIDLSAFTDLPFMLIACAGVCTTAAYYIPLLYLPSLTVAFIPRASADLAFDLIAILNGTSGIGRVLAGLLAAKIGPTEAVTLAMIASAVILFSWIAVESVAGVVVWAAFFGLASGAIVALPGAFVPLFCPSMNVIGTRLGMIWTSIGLGFLMGAPIGGAINDLGSAVSDTWRLKVFAGCVMMGAALFMIYPLIHLRQNNRRAAG